MARVPVEILERLPLEPPVSGEETLMLQYDNVCADDRAHRTLALPMISLHQRLLRMLADRQRKLATAS